MNIETNEIRFLEDIPQYDDVLGVLDSPWVPVPKKYQHKASKLLKGAPAGTPVYGDPNWIKPQRNSPCLCGSGKKYKHCCGAAGGTE